MSGDDARSLVKAYLERVLPIVLRNSELKTQLAKLETTNLSREKKAHLHMLVAATLSTTIGPPASAIIPLSVIIARTLVKQHLTESDIRNPDP